MSKKKNDKKIISLEPQFKDVFVCHDQKLRPYQELFVVQSENVSGENLGYIAGIFEIADNSEDSSYVVNYLISIIKKEYFSRPKRGVIESFEAALHKANLALSKLASHGNINWIGRLNAVCAVIEKGNLHISNTGMASVLLMRSNSLTNISEGGTDVSEANPLKTFQDVLSGRLENGDKLIIATDNIFEIFSLEEIKRSALKFSQSEFIQFLNTALVNELEKTAVIIIDIREKEEEKLVLPKKNAGVNAFSQAAFQKTFPDEAFQNKQDEKKEIIRELREEYQKTQSGFVDRKTGHIYIKDGNTAYENQISRLELFSAGREKLVHTGSNFVVFIKKFFAALFSGIKFKKLPQPEKLIRTPVEEEMIREAAGEVPLVIREESSEKSISFRIKFGLIFSKTAFFLKRIFVFVKNSVLYKIITLAYRGIKKRIPNLMLKYKEPKKLFPSSVPDSSYNHPEIHAIYPDRKAIWKERTAYLEKSSRPKISLLFRFVLPSFSKIKNITKNISPAQKIYAALVSAAFVVIPYLIVRYENKSEKVVFPIQENQEVPVLPLNEDKNVIRLDSLSNVYEGENILSTVSLNGRNFAVKTNEIVSLENGKNYLLPDEFQNADLVSQMDDLNLIFITKNKKILSFSATAGKFQENNISFPDNAVASSARSYLTYLYVLDGKNNQIYRYPRSEGGFGEKTDWLKSFYDITNASDMAINDNIYILNGKNILKFFRGKQQDYSFEENATRIIPDKLYTKPISENLYVLDKANSRIAKLNKDGNIMAQYYNNAIASIKDFSVDEENNVIYVSSEKSVKSFSISTQ
jgi:hypothetical protein